MVISIDTCIAWTLIRDEKEALIEVSNLIAIIFHIDIYKLLQY